MKTVTDAREKMANQLLMRGSATMMELLTASFGEWPIAGLDINQELLHGQKIDFKQLLDDQGDMARASAMGDRERIIWLNKSKCDTRDRLVSSLGHESVHILQGDHSGRMPAEKKESFLERLGGWVLGMRKSGASPSSHLIMLELLSRDDNLSSRFQRFVAGLEPNKDLSYLSRGIEMQACLHEVMMEGYACAWHRLPATRDELWAAMRNAGFKPPPAVNDYLDALPDTSSARHFDAWRFGYQKIVAVSDMELVLKELSDKGKETFWNETLPALYADLIEMYGDKPGRERFGLGKNPKNNIPLKKFPGQVTPS